MQRYQKRASASRPVISIHELIDPFLDDIRAAERRFVACGLHYCRDANNAAAACHLTSASFTCGEWRLLFDRIVSAAQEGQAEFHILDLDVLNKSNGAIWGINIEELRSLFFAEWNRELLPTLGLRVAEFSRRLDAVKRHVAAISNILKEPNVPDVSDAASAELAFGHMIIVPTHLARRRRKGQ